MTEPLKCKTHGRAHPYKRCPACGCEFCDLAWKACPRCAEVFQLSAEGLRALRHEGPVFVWVPGTTGDPPRRAELATGIEHGASGLAVGYRLTVHAIGEGWAYEGVVERGGGSFAGGDASTTHERAVEQAVRLAREFIARAR